jgi:hypothetical protein
VQIQDRLIAALRRCCQALPDRQWGKNTTHVMADFALAAFAPFCMQSPSFLAHQRHLETAQGRSNCETLFGMSKIPGDSQIRAMLDPIEPALFYPVACPRLRARACTHVMSATERPGILRLPDAAQVRFAFLRQPTDRSRHGHVAWDIRRSAPRSRGAAIREQMAMRKTVCLRRLGGNRGGELRAGRFFASPKVTVAKLIEGWSGRTGEACAGRHVLAIQDTSEVKFPTTAQRRRGRGPVGEGNGYGVLVHAMVARRADRVSVW